MSTTYAVIGASRGIGLEYVRQLSARPDTVVFAVVRNKESSSHLTALATGLKNVHIVEGDVADYASMERSAETVRKLSDGKLDYLIHNAARMSVALAFQGFQDFNTVDELDADLIDAFKVNALGIVHSIQAYLPLLRAGATKKIVVIGTGGALYSIVSKARLGNMVAYATGKAAGTMITTKYALQLEPEGFVVVTLTPGFVDTSGTQAESVPPEYVARMAKELEKVGESGYVPVKVETVEHSTALQLKVIDGLTAAQNGKILGHDGNDWTD